MFFLSLYLWVHYVKTSVNSPQTISYTSVFINKTLLTQMNREMVHQNKEIISKFPFWEF